MQITTISLFVFVFVFVCEITKIIIIIIGSNSNNSKLLCLRVTYSCSRKPLVNLVIYQREVDKRKLTAVASFEKLTFRA